MAPTRSPGSNTSSRGCGNASRSSSAAPKWVRRTFFGACAVLAGLIVWRLILGDFFGAVLVAVMSLIFVLWCLPYRRKRRLTDLLGAREVEEMIVLREKRLAEIKRRPA